MHERTEFDILIVTISSLIEALITQIVFVVMALLPLATHDYHA